ncbi:MAG: FHA domain-containing protein [Phaeodactylibacter sp.]|nr:FHA domain-containing protein [Phaeodactylibacter sp.]
MATVKNLVLHIQKEGRTLKKIRISKDGTYDLGRNEACHITINAQKISRNHLSTVFQGGKVFVRDNDSSNGTAIQGQPLQAQEMHPITQDTYIDLSQGEITLYLELELAEVQQPVPAAQPKRVSIKADPSNSQQLQGTQILELLNERGEIVIGRAPDCDLVLPSLMVSRKHAVLKKEASGITLQDQNSTNGTFVNGSRIQGMVRIEPSDQITIGPSNFYLKGGLVDPQYAIVAENIEKVYPGGYVGLNKMSIKIPTREFVALMGPSGCGKSTLLKGLNGANPITSGSVTIQGLQLNKSNFNTLKQHIGYVPQDDIVHRELTVQKTLFYAAKLRMAKDVTNEEINEKIDQVLKSLNLNANAIRHNKIRDLSGGQRKRISIAVELLNDPTILFLDEPTSPLDPETIEDFLKCIQGLVQKGQTVIMVTHKPSDLNYVDKVIFLSKGGFHTYYGEKDSILEHFDRKNLIEVYSLMKDPNTGKKWYQSWLQQHPMSVVQKQSDTLEPKPSTSIFRQFYWLSRRYFNIKWNDKWNLGLLMAQPFIIAFLLIFIFTQLQISVLFLMAISAVWFGVSNASKEIVAELPIYDRERMFNLHIGNYIASKVVVLSVIALVQVLLFVGIIFLTYKFRDDAVLELWSFWPNVGFMFFLSVSATIFGLLLSAVFSNTEKVMTFVPIALMPQIMLAGIISQLNNNLKTILSYFTLGRWGTEGFAHIQDNAASNIGEWADEEQSIPAGVMQLKPQAPPEPELPTDGSLPPPPDTTSVPPTIEMELQPEGAMESLNLYGHEDVSVSLFPEDFSGVVLAIMILNVICLAGIYIALKRKDKKFS